MQVILLEKVANLGNLGDVVKVKDGYARNFLIPQGKAYEASRANLRHVEALKVARARREAEELHREMRDAGVLDQAVLVFGQMDEPPGARFRVGHAALTIAALHAGSAIVSSQVAGMLLIMSTAGLSSSFCGCDP